MKDLQLSATTRLENVTPPSLRRVGRVPAIMYGKEIDPVRVDVEARAVEKVLMQGGRNRIIYLDVQGSGTHPVMIKEIQVNPVKGSFTHIDFHKVSLKEKIHVFVPVLVQGSDEVEKRGGIIQHQMREVEVQCLPTDIPERIVADISHLNVGDHIDVSDLKFPANVEVIEDGSSMILTIVAPKHAEEEVTPDLGRVEPEVIGKKAEEKE